MMLFTKIIHLELKNSDFQVYKLEYKALGFCARKSSTSGSDCSLLAPSVFFTLHLQSDLVNNISSVNEVLNAEYWKEN